MKETDELTEAAFFTEETKDFVEECIELEYNFYSMEIGEPILEQRGTNIDDASCQPTDDF